MEKAYLVLQTGEVFEGVSFGAPVEQTGELVFTTGMCGYIETLTDPSYYGQIVLQTFPLIGNYGVIPEDFEGQCRVSGYVVREACEHPSNFRSQGTLDEFLKAQGVPGISGVDTRALTRILREHGTMNARICRTPPENLGGVASYRIVGAVEAVTSPAVQALPPEGEKTCRVALIDYGAKANIARELQKRGAEVIVLPASVTASEVLSLQPDGLMLSNGPGDPAECLEQIETLRQLAGRLPTFGICLGHQLLALALGAKTGKLKYGHRGGNQPVKDLLTGRTYVTSQNHGYAVLSDTLPCGRLRFVNANDQTCEGIDYPEINAFTVQFHPEARSGPHDCNFLFDRFFEQMGVSTHAAQ